MEPPKSVEDDDIGSPKHDEPSIDGTTFIVQGADQTSNSVDGSGSPDASEMTMPGADAQGDADPLSVEQWLAAATTGDDYRTTSDGRRTPSEGGAGTGHGTVVINAEQAAAAEPTQQAYGDTDSDGDSDTDIDTDGESDGDGEDRQTESGSAAALDQEVTAEQPLDPSGTTAETPAAEDGSVPAPDQTEEMKASGLAIASPMTIPGARTPVLRRRALSIGMLFVVVVLGAYLMLIMAWGIDLTSHRGEAMRGVHIAATDVGGSDRPALEATVAGLQEELGARPLEIVVGDTTIESDPVTLGARLDAQAMVNEALGAKRGGLLPLRPLVWAGGLFNDYTIEPSYTVDPQAVVDGAAAVIAPTLDEPVEPTLDQQGEEITATAGSPGKAIETDEIVQRLPGLVAAGEPYRLDLATRDTEPALATSVVSDIADEINRQTSQPITVNILDDDAEVSPAIQKGWIELVVDGDKADWTVIEERAIQDLKPMFPTLGSEDQQARFTVVDGKPVILPASESVICCESGSGRLLEDAIRREIPPLPEDQADDKTAAPTLRSVVLEPIVTDEGEGVAELESLGIVEEVSTFTTNHACCQNRVKNIQRFADLTQGAVIRPGEVFSLNDHVGERTIAKGFVADGAISLGNFEQQVGGGISQYATTFFNASFFAGVEFVEYQSHSIYISRYPRGREATISWRRPDLKILNNTPYGIMVWNEYTPTSITVSFYSTKHLTVDALPLKRSSNAECRIDITPRRITHPDGTQSEDSVFALYRPGEGLDCNGEPTTPKDEPKPASPTTVPTPPPTTPATPTTTPPTTPTTTPPTTDPEVLPPG